ncbi:titin-like, partial [Salvelinus sp. IW2-2015]|uniref:titin-like n=1 Tax=Salvelinus sp. IW2-2015 TaxID=2691554 RepID=UPI0038D4D548
YSRSTVTTVEEEQESYTTGLQLPQTSKTLELQPESKYYSSTLEDKKEKPIFLTQLSPAAVNVGESAIFTITVSGLPKPTVQWFHNGKVITSSSIYKLVQEKDEYTLIISEVKTEYKGEYTCTASNRFGQTTCTTYLEVSKRASTTAEQWVEKMFKATVQPPNFTSQIKPIKCQEGGEAYFKYKVTGDPIPDVQWYKSARQIQPGKYCIIVNNPDGSGFINMKGIQQQDSGLYTCKASNPSGEASCSADLIVFKEPISVSQRKEHMVVQKGYKVSMTAEQATESRLYEVNLPGETRARDQAGHQMVYTIGTEDSQVVSSEQVQTLRELDMSAATVQRERVTHQAAVLQSHEVQERVSVGVTLPPEVSVVSTKQHRTAPFHTSAVQDSPQLTEQHCDRIQSPVVVELQSSKEKRSKLMSATSEEMTTLASVSTEMSGERKTDKVKPTSEPKHLVSSHLVESQLSILKERSQDIPKPQEEKSYKVKEGIKILYSAMSTEKQMIPEGHTTDVPSSDSALQSSVTKESFKPILASVSETKQTLSKETKFTMQRPEAEKALLRKDYIMKSALTAEEKQMLQAEQTKQVKSLESATSLFSQVEGEQVLHLQIIRDQDILPSEEPFTCEKPAVEQAGARKSPTLLHTVTHDERTSVTCEDTTEFEAKRDTMTIQPQKQAPTPLHLQSFHPGGALTKEGIITIEKPAQQTATQKQEKARKHAASSEEKMELSADYSKDLDVSVTGVQSKLRTEPRPQNILQVTSKPMQISKETPFTSDAKQQRALIQKEDRWNIMQVTSVADSQALEEGHTESLTAVDKFSCKSEIEPKVPAEPIQIEEKAIATESSVLLEATEQDFAIQIQEGQSVRQSIMMDEKRILIGEMSQQITKSESTKVSLKTQHKMAVFVSESGESRTLPKELTFVIQIPKPTSLDIRRQLKDALQSAVALDQPLILADVVGSLEATEVQEVKVLKEPRRAMFTYLITTPGAPMEITLAFEGQYPKTADLRTELQAAFYSIIYHEQHVLTSEQPGTLQIDKPQRLKVSSASSKEILSSVVETVKVAESVVDFTTPKSQAAKRKTESRATHETATAEERIVVQESKVTQSNLGGQVMEVTTESHAEFEQTVQVARQEVRTMTVKGYERDVGMVDITTDMPMTSIPTEQSVDVLIQKEHREEFISEEVKKSKSQGNVKDYPIIETFLEDITTEEHCKVTYTVTVKYVTKANWLFNGQIIQSGKEFKCSKEHDTYTLTIMKIIKEKHEGEYVFEAVNEAGKTTTSSRLTVVSK